MISLFLIQTIAEDIFSKSRSTIASIETDIIFVTHSTSIKDSIVSLTLTLDKGVYFISISYRQMQKKTVFLYTAYLY